MQFPQVLSAKQLTVLRFARDGEQHNVSLPTYRRAVVHLTRLDLLTPEGTLSARGRAVLEEFAAALKG